MTKITFLKIGNITLTTLVDIMIDERATRKDIDATVLSSSTKLSVEAAEKIIKLVDHVETELLVIVSPNANLDGPKRLIDEFAGKYPTLLVSDAGDKETREQWREKGVGYLIAPFDPMIGAKKDFLDPAEMCLFNAHITAAFSSCGVFSYITYEIDKIIEQMNNGEEVKLPYKYLSSMEVASFLPYASEFSRAKAIAALEMLTQAGKINVKGCYVEKDREKSLLLLAAAHEMVRQTSLIADEIRENEKAVDKLVRYPHATDGKWLHKTQFFEESKEYKHKE